MDIKNDIFKVMKFRYINDFEKFMYDGKQFIRVPAIMENGNVKYNAFYLRGYTYSFIDLETKVALNPLEGMYLCALNKGDTFVYESKIYMKIDFDDTNNVFCFDDNAGLFINPDAEVFLVKTTLLCDVPKD